MKNKKESEQVDTKNNPFHWLHQFPKTSIQYWKEHFKQKTQFEKQFLVCMFLRTGKPKLMVITTNENCFLYQKAKYIIDADFIYDEQLTRFPLLFYHQDIALPFKHNFDFSELRKSLKDTYPKVHEAINPQTLEAFIMSQVIEKVLKGQELSDEMRFIKIVVVVSGIVTFITAFLVAKMSGVF